VVALAGVWIERAVDVRGVVAIVWDAGLFRENGWIFAHTHVARTGEHAAGFGLRGGFGDRVAKAAFEIERFLESA